VIREANDIAASEIDPEAGREGYKVWSVFLAIH
jgi:hypothetical protein